MEGRISMRALVGAAIAALVLVASPFPVAGAAVPGGDGQRLAADAAAADDRPATELRVTLSRLLGEHAFLVTETMRTASLGGEEQAALRIGLDDSSSDITAAVASVYGGEAGTAFGEIWQDHIDLLIDYAEASRAGDQAGMTAAQRGLDRYVDELAAFLAQANPQFDAEREAAALTMHVGQLTAFIDADFDAAFAAQRDAYEHMFDLGDHLALGMARQFPDRFPDGAVAFSPRTDLRLTLDRLLGEHLILAAQTMRSGVTRAPDLGAGAAALDANTDDLAAAVASVYGADAGAAFNDVWQAHVTAYVRYVDALGEDDAAARDAALSELHDYHDRIAAFLASANPNLSEEAVAALVRRHVQALISQAEATAAGDHERAVATTREAYAGMFDVGAALADAIVTQFPDRFRDLEELPGTATAEKAGIPVAVSPLLSAVVSALVVAAVLAGLALRHGGPRSARHGRDP